MLVAVRGGFAEVPAAELSARRNSSRLGLPGAEAVYSFGFNSDPVQEGWTFINKNVIYSRGWKWDDPKSSDAAGMKVYEGTGCLYSQSFDNLTSSPLKPDNWAVSPGVALPEEGNCAVSFWAIGQDSGYTEEYFAVYAGTTANVDEMTRVSPARDFRANPDGNYHRYTADLTAFAGQTVYVAIRHYNSTNQFALVIDAVEISQAPHPMVYFDANGGTVEPEYLEVTEQSLPALPAPVREGYYFAGWFDNVTGGSSICAGVPITGTVTAIARWIPLSRQVCGRVFGLDFNDDTPPEGWTLEGWSLARDGSGAAIAEGAGVLRGQPGDGETARAVLPELQIPYGYSQLSFIARAEASEPAAQLTVTALLQDGTEQPMGTVTPSDEAFGSFCLELGDLAGENVRLCLTTDGAVCLDLLELWGHQYQLETTQPTCTQQGYTTFTCERCGNSFVDEYVDALGHDWSEWIEEIAPTCTEEGEEYRGCSRCDATQVRPLEAMGHAWGEPVYTWAEDNSSVTALRVCGNDESHLETETVSTTAVTTAPTFTQDGQTVYTAVFSNPAFAEQTKTVVLPKPVNPFVDVPENKYYFAPVLWAYYHDPRITSGTDDTHFSPNKTCTREQIVTFLWKAYGAPEPTSTEHPFTDVKPGKYYEKAILWAVENHITSGTSATTFGVGKACTREQVVTFLWKAAGAPEPKSTTHSFTDVVPGKYYEKPILWALENGITKGMTETTFGVGKPCTRAQVVTFLYVAVGGKAS